MAMLQSEYTIKVGEDGIVKLRDPSNKEFAEYENSLTKVKRNKVTFNTAKAKAKLFDACIISIENLEDKAGPITKETAKERIPMRKKGEWIDKMLADDSELDEDGGDETGPLTD